MRPVSRAATVITPFWAPSVNIIVSSRSTHRSRIITDENIQQAYQFSMIIERVYSQLGYLPVHCIKLMLFAACGSSIDKNVLNAAKM